eukprot:TRINITY_DN2385_c0_g1_i1.p1 TRINITY_DN2385_c0_g1~~TRINITY_DN2385_c0_g1_i1.p1  ORF type:complete len:408 (+),score=100.94 TRINITY_DN2385_c0_g1_i1:184-1224(+)
MGEATSHLQGMFSRTIKLIEYGLKPIYVFDGKPPTLKTGELAKRSKKKTEAAEELSTAREEADQEAVEKFSKRTVKVTKEQNEEAKRLLRLMGVPVITAPCEAEAQCAHMAKSGLVYATASEDMDSLTLGTPILLRHLTFSEARKLPVMEIHLDRLLEGLGLTMAQFVDLCILCGCDYCDTIRGIGPKRALELIKKYGKIEEILKNIDSKKYIVPENFPFESVRELFHSPEVQHLENSELKWVDPDEEGLVEFLVKEKGFNEERVKKGIEKLKKNKSTSVQGRLDTFFTPAPPSTSDNNSSTASPQKRKVLFSLLSLFSLSVSTLKVLFCLGVFGFGDREKKVRKV